jgi:hypothetical protein
MNKKTTIIIIVTILIIIGLGAGGYIYWNNQKKSKAAAEASQKAKKAADAVLDSALKGVLPPLEINPLENKPDLNPVEKANPYKNIKTNPFE